MQLIPFPFAHELVEELLNGPKTTKEGTEITLNDPNEIEVQSNRVQGNPAPAKTSDKIEENQLLGAQVNQANAEIQQATFSEFEQIELNKKEQRNLNNLLDIPLKVTVELGRTKRPI